MRKRIVSWAVAAAATIGLLIGAHYIVRSNANAMAGQTNGERSGFYGH
jgi:hypothetical protein